MCDSNIPTWYHFTTVHLSNVDLLRGNALLLWGKELQITSSQGWNLWEIYSRLLVNGKRRKNEAEEEKEDVGNKPFVVILNLNRHIIYINTSAVLFLWLMYVCVNFYMKIYFKSNSRSVSQKWGKRRKRKKLVRSRNSHYVMLTFSIFKIFLQQKWTTRLCSYFLNSDFTLKIKQFEYIII